MAPAWLISLLSNIGIGLTKWAFSEIQAEAERLQQAAELEKSQGIRDGNNAKKYAEAKTRKEQIAAAIDLINRNN